MIGDEAALKSSVGFKGISGNRICFECKNCIRKAARLAGEYLIKHDCSVFRLFDRETDDGAFYL